MTYDDYGYYTRGNVTRHHSGYEYCIEILEFFHNKGVSKRKLLLGIPFYGRSFTLIDPSRHGVGAPIVQITEEGTPSKDFVDICLLIKSRNLTKDYGNESAHWDPYAYEGNYWVGYDDPQQAFMY